MKSFAAVLSVLLTLAFSGTASAGSGLRTDINPALLYWQAISQIPDSSDADHGYVFTNEWRGRALDERFNAVMARYDNAFKLLRHAGRQTVFCDWGYDIREGPELLLPSLAKTKTLTQAARLRVRWHLENDRPDDARDDLLAAFTLGRQVSRDGILISALVQIAIENILVSGVAENWFRFPPETLKQVMDGIAAAPQRGTIAESVRMERAAFKGWLVRRITEIQSASANDQDALPKVRALLHSLMDGGDEASQVPDSPTPEQVIESAGGTTVGLLRQLEELDPLYDELDALMREPYEMSINRLKSFGTRIWKQPNLLARVFLPAFEKCRLKEFAIEVKLSMLQAAVDYAQTGASAVIRPDNSGQSFLRGHFQGTPFRFRRFIFDGVDRGFALEYDSDPRPAGPILSSSLIFVENDGPAFHLDGPSVGKPVK